MKLTPAKKRLFRKKLDTVVATPATFDLFVAIHDFVHYVERDATASRSAKRLNKYADLKQIWQGVEDIKASHLHDLGHERQTTLRDLKRIRDRETHDSNLFWKKRETYRNITIEVHEHITA